MQQTLKSKSLDNLKNILPNDIISDFKEHVLNEDDLFQSLKIFIRYIHFSTIMEILYNKEIRFTDKQFIALVEYSIENSKTESCTFTNKHCELVYCLIYKYCFRLFSDTEYIEYFLTTYFDKITDKGNDILHVTDVLYDNNESELFYNGENKEHAQELQKVVSKVNLKFHNLYYTQ
jgi:hypothetical protein